MTNFVNLLEHSWREEGGASAVEYAVWFGTIAVGLAVGAFVLL